MCRFIFLVILVILLICGIGSVFGEDVLLWTMLIGVVGAPMGLLFFPKRGVQYAFRNQYRRLAFMLMIVLAGILFGGLYLLGMLLPADTSTATNTFGIFVIAVLSFVATYILIQPINPPTRGKIWLRRNYPSVSKAIKHYQKKAEVLDDYTPALIINQAPYFLIAFTDRGKREATSGALLLDEMGNPNRDEILFQKALQCKTVAIQTIDYARNSNLARAITNAEHAYAGLKEVFDILRQEEENILQHSKESGSDFEKIYAAEEPIRLYTDVTIGIQLMEARWSKKNGLSKLTAVKYDDVASLIDEIQQSREESVAHYSTITVAAEPANRLAKVMQEIPFHIPQKKKVVEGLLGISDMGKMLVGHEVFEYAPPTDADWQAWRAGLAWADQVDAGAGE